MLAGVGDLADSRGRLVSLGLHRAMEEPSNQSRAEKVQDAEEANFSRLKTPEILAVWARACTGAKRGGAPEGGGGARKIRVCFWSVRPAGRSAASPKHARHIRYRILDNGGPCQQ